MGVRGRERAEKRRTECAPRGSGATALGGVVLLFADPTQERRVREEGERERILSHGVARRVGVGEHGRRTGEEGKASGAVVAAPLRVEGKGNRESAWALEWSSIPWLRFCSAIVITQTMQA